MKPTVTNTVSLIGIVGFLLAAAIGIGMAVGFAVMGIHGELG